MLTLSKKYFRLCTPKMPKIPADAKKVYDWMLFDVYHFEIIWTDGKPRTFERVRWYDVAKAICIVDWKIIVTNEIHPDREKVSIPWWMLHKEEDPLQGIKREVKEETWFEFRDRTFITEFSLGASNIEMYRYYYVAAHPLSKSDIQLDEWWEKIELVEYSIPDFLDALQNNKTAVRDLSERYQKNPKELDMLLL